MASFSSHLPGFLAQQKQIDLDAAHEKFTNPSRALYKLGTPTLRLYDYADWLPSICHDRWQQIPSEDISTMIYTMKTSEAYRLGLAPVSSTEFKFPQKQAGLTVHKVILKVIHASGNISHDARWWTGLPMISINFMTAKWYVFKANY